MILYRLAITLLALRELMRRGVGRDATGLMARLGRTHAPDDTPRIWLHAASNGEVTSVKPVIDRLLDAGKSVLLTANTATAVAMARAWNVENLDAHLAPVDLPAPTRRVFAQWHVTAHIAVESELWPYRILTCPGPVLVLGARLTERSAKGWRRFETLAHRVVGKIDYLTAQDAGSLKRLSAFGLQARAKGPVFDLKALYTPPKDAPDSLLRAAFPRQATWLAASTHDGEDATVLKAHQLALETRPDLKLILAPRHPGRADAIADLITEHGLTVARRSRGDAPTSADVYLADTMGEMHLWYALAGVTFVAGSLTDRGGHTPYEPAFFGSAILHGPDTANFKAAYGRLHTSDAAVCVTDAATLAAALNTLADPDTLQAAGLAAKTALQQNIDIDGLMRDVIAALDA